MKRARVLIIQENRRTVGELNSNFEEQGYETEVALSGEIGLEILGEREMDVAVIDHNLSGFEEWELLKVLKDKLPHMPVVLINGPRERGISRVARQAGATRFMRAPVNIERVITTVDTVVCP